MGTLFIFAGLPGVGKTTLSRRLAQRFRAVHLRVDTIEQALRDLCHWDVQGEGYRLAYRVAGDNLRLGLNVVADSCNPLEITRKEWEQAAQRHAADFVNIEVVCSDVSEHRRRIESRRPSILGMTLPTWLDVENRRYQNWSSERIVVDTAGRPIEDCLEWLVDAIGSSASQNSP